MTGNHHLPRLYFPLALKAGDVVLLPEGQSHYLKNVLRRAEGDGLRLFNAVHGEWVARIGFQGKKAVSAAIESQSRAPFAASAEVHLFYSPIKKDRNDLLIEKAVELGATHLHPVLFQRTIVREVKPDRIESQMIEAAEQCERLDVPALLPLLDLKKAMAGWDASLPLFAAIERMDATALKPYTGSCGYLVGPEGGIAPEEVEFLCSKSFVKPVTLGPRILRAETAAFYGLSRLSQ